MAVLSIWEAVVRLRHIDPLIMPAPTAIGAAMIAYISGGSFIVDVLATLHRMGLGLLIGMIVGTGLGLLLAWYPNARAAVYPFVAVTFPVPKAALVPLLMVWFGKGEAFKILLVAIGVTYIALVNTMAGVESLPAVTTMASRNLGASDRQLFRHVILPAAMPAVLASLRVSFSLALVLMIVAEMIVSPDGLGHFIVTSGEALETEKVFAGVVISGVIGLVGYQLIDALERSVLRWRRA